MSSSIYQRLAIVNIKNNHKTYVPYILTSILTVMMYFIMYGLKVNESITSGSITDVLGYATWVVAIFAVIFLFYTNSFLIKRRKKEIGVYNVLGMARGHIAKMLIVESLITAVVSIVSGLLLGILFSKLMWWALLKLIHYNIRMKFEISQSAIISTILLFCIIFAMTLLYNLMQIRLANPVELLHAKNAGEKEPKTKWLLTLFGVVCISFGYYIALTVESPLEAFFKFFVAVIAVVLGTYALFIAGSIVVLKALRRNKKFYYQSHHFTAVSGMLYRMKQNAAGLANICILSTMVLVLVSTSVSMYIGCEDIINTRFPQEMKVIQRPYIEGQEEQVQKIISDVTEKHQVKVKNESAARQGLSVAVRDGSHLSLREKGNYTISTAYELVMIPQEDYARMTGENPGLKDDELILYTTESEMYGRDTIQIEDKTYQVVKELESMWVGEKNENRVTPAVYLVMKDIEEVEYWLQFIYDHSDMKEEWKDEMRQIEYQMSFDLSGAKENRIEAAREIQEQIATELPGVRYDSRELERESFFVLYGGLFFIGIYLGILFLMATVLIIYYKQISEGYDDRERYQIMQKVGMSKREVRRSIKSQVLMVFFLPLVVAIIHVAVAFPVVKKLLAVLSLENGRLFLACTAGTIAVFAIFYGIVFSVTAREYYKIVNE